MSEVLGGELQGGDLAIWDESLEGLAPYATQLAEVMLAGKPKSHLEETCWSYEGDKLVLTLEGEVADGFSRVFSHLV